MHILFIWTVYWVWEKTSSTRWVLQLDSDKNEPCLITTLFLGVHRILSPVLANWLVKCTHLMYSYKNANYKMLSIHAIVDCIFTYHYRLYHNLHVTHGRINFAKWFADIKPRKNLVIFVAHRHPGPLSPNHLAKLKRPRVMYIYHNYKIVIAVRFYFLCNWYNTVVLFRLWDPKIANLCP